MRHHDFLEQHVLAPLRACASFAEYDALELPDAFDERMMGGEKVRAKVHRVEVPLPPGASGASGARMKM